MKNHFIRTFHELETKCSHQSNWLQWPCWTPTWVWLMLTWTLPILSTRRKGSLFSCAFCLKTLSSLSLEKVYFLLNGNRRSSRSGAGKQLRRKDEKVTGNLTSRSPGEEASRSQSQTRTKWEQRQIYFFPLGRTGNGSNLVPRNLRGDVFKLPACHCPFRHPPWSLWGSHLQAESNLQNKM